LQAKHSQSRARRIVTGLRVPGASDRGCEPSQLTVGSDGGLPAESQTAHITAQGRTVVGLDTRKPRRNLVLLEPAVAQLCGRGRSVS